VGFAEQAGCLRAAQTVGFLVTNRQHEVQISACYKVRNFPENMMFLNCTVLGLLNLLFVFDKSLNVGKGTRESVDLIALSCASSACANFFCVQIL
jgi:hypothetical protein